MTYYDDAQGWHSDRMKWLKRALLTLPSIGFVAMFLVAALEAIALMGLAPIKEIRTLPVHYDEAAQRVTFLKTDEFERVREVTKDETLIGQYVWMAESRYPDAGMFQDLLVRFRSTPDAYAAWRKRLAEDYAKGRKVGEVVLEEIFAMNDEGTVYRVQYRLEREAPWSGECKGERKPTRDQQCIRVQSDFFVARLKFFYSDSPIALGQRWMNGEGFLVDYFTRTERAPTHTTFKLAAIERR